MNNRIVVCCLLAGAVVPAIVGITAAVASGAEAAPVVSQARLQESRLAYRDGELALEGFLAVDPSRQGKLPGVLVVHDWRGLNPYAMRRARALAQQGFVALAIDMYGAGVSADTPEAAAKLAAPFRSDRALMRRRVAAALAVLKADPRVDPARIVAIGYCFGGTCVLELARAGADLAGVVSFHGGLDTPQPDATAKPKAAILVCHGAADPHVSAASLTAFCAEMNRCGADWQLNMYGGAVHSFSDPDAGSDASKGAAYQAEADARSWTDLQQFLKRIIWDEKAPMSGSVRQGE